MLGLNATNLLTAWEQGISQHPLQRAVTLLALAWPQRSVDDWASASIGERDRQLLQLRDELFGAKFEAVAACPNCGERLELEFSTQDLLAQVAETSTSPRALRLESGGYEVGYRLPTTADLLAVADSPDRARELLLERCVEAVSEGVAIPASALPGEVSKLLGQKMADADPQADVHINLDCPACSHHWATVFDVLSYLWGEIDDWAQRLLHDVHSLASTYGWSERDILSMSATRRRLYLELAGA
ncbi:MAG: phage baseplate protein [Pyrinomonadaceae bacterium]